MARQRWQGLTVMSVNAKKEPGYYGDGGGLYLRVAPGGSKSWAFFFNMHGRRCEMGLGSVKDKPLAVVREEAHRCRQFLSEGIDPIAHRKAQRQSAKDAVQKTRTFSECAIEYYESHRTSWRNQKHGKQWIDSLITYAFTIFGEKNINDIGKADILAVLEPIWVSRHETAVRVRQRMKAIFDWAAARDLRTTQDAHLWDQITRSLPRTKDLRKPKHFAACPYSQVAAVIQTIRACGASSSIRLAMEFTILTTARTGMVRLAVWSEFDMEKARWTIPAPRMKAGVEHRIPLSECALEILRERARNRPLKDARPTDLVFPPPGESRTVI
ncbi:integrase arm-type DNA-binding domain-containing protein [Massilia sp. METH4]|uniref:tyrosine-type recombinase/integrase n=1 Tax=Massilia sp. METH4 TaxID=3123041 RepID=UPI0030CFAA09